MTEYGTALGVERLRAVLARTGPDNVSLGAEVFTSAAFRSHEWPHAGYGILRADLEAAVGEIDLARSLRVDVVSLRAAIDPVVHTVARVCDYLWRAGFKQVASGRTAAEWERRDDRAAVLVPLVPTAADWRKRMALMVSVLATAQDCGELAILAEIAASPCTDTAVIEVELPDYLQEAL